ncbi:ATP-binding protein [Kitasatospora purpeofusca]|uniref:ATP-binding protein n=1 Tax=Kitasatospora purpeofusca TaxID=67352 RepID=A0ABZ1U0F7_9ACTN|nr:ATP-binding protein [Kitasatospora purpeofusca]
MLMIMFSLPAETRSAGQARLKVAAELAASGMRLGRDEEDDIKVVVSELVGNAVKHGCGGDRPDIQLPVELLVTDDVLRMSVTDPTAVLPLARTAGNEDECGRGLQLVAALTTAHGTEQLDTGKRVWAEMKLTNTPIRPGPTAATAVGEAPRPLVARFSAPAGHQASGHCAPAFSPSTTYADDHPHSSPVPTSEKRARTEMRRIATYGRPGAGKSTLTGMLQEQLTSRGLTVVKIRLAEPLYALQGTIYHTAGRKLASAEQQDGQLLNALGAHLRRINPTALTDAFANKVNAAVEQEPDAVVLCDDARAADIDALHDLGFSFVQVWAPDDLRTHRKAGRGDLAPGDENHPTEAAITITPQYRVENTGSLEMLRVRAAELAAEVTR